MVLERRRRTETRRQDDRELIGWRKQWDVGVKPRLTRRSRLELVSFSDIEKNGGQLLLRGDFGRSQARSLWDRREEIPVSWREFILVFPGTGWMTPENETVVSYLIYWQSADQDHCRWVLVYGRLADLIRNEQSRIVRLAE